MYTEIRGRPSLDNADIFYPWHGIARKGMNPFAVLPAPIGDAFRLLSTVTTRCFKAA